MDHKLLRMASRGIHLADFIANIVYPFFANQLYYDASENKKYAGNEYGHHFDGVRQFYAEDLKITDTNLAIKAIEVVLGNSIPGRNNLCICGVRKFKRCHADSIAFLKTLPTYLLKRDLDGFKELQ